MKFTSVKKALPNARGSYSVQYKAPKSSKIRTGKAKYTKKNGWSDVVGVSGKLIGLSADVLDLRPDQLAVDTRPSSRPVIVAWSE